MKRPGLSAVFLVGLIFLMLAVSQAEEKKDVFDSQPLTDTPSFNNTFKEAPGMSFDVPKDAQITNVNNSIQVEAPTHYMFRKVAIQDKQIGDLKEQLKELLGRLSVMEARLGPTAEATPKRKLSSLEEPALPPDQAQN